MTFSDNPPQRDSYKFIFKGYSIWLELEQVDKDFDKVLTVAANDLGLYRVPTPHVTAAYGITHLSQTEVCRRFTENVGSKISNWPRLKLERIKTGVSFDGFDGQEMDMAWIELSIATTEENERMIDLIYDIFYDGNERESFGRRPEKWTPHLSLAYDNPINSPINIDYSFQLIRKFPTLLTHCRRRVIGTPTCCV
jgi:hypothetical protein